MLFFLGNKAFVIDFLETGQFCCVYWYDRLGYKSLGKYISPTRISTGLHSNLSGVLLLSVNKCTVSKCSALDHYLLRKKHQPPWKNFHIKITYATQKKLWIIISLKYNYKIIYSTQRPRFYTFDWSRKNEILKGL